MINQMFILVLGCISLINVTWASPQSNRKDDLVVSWNFGSIIHPKNKSIEFDLKFFSPTVPGNYPVFAFLTGLDGIAPSYAYNDFCSRLAIETNSIIVAFDTLRFPSFPNKEELLFESTLNWTLQNLNGLFNSKNTPAKIKDLVFPDLKTYGVRLLSHSAAGHPTVSYLVKSCGLIKSLILMDPVDGYDPFGLVKIFVTNPPNQLDFQIPTLILSTKYSAYPSNQIFPPCAPQNISNVRFYQSLPGPTWYLNFTQYGHADILDDWIRQDLTYIICKVCVSNCLYPLYREVVAKTISYFLAGVEGKNQFYIDAIQNPTDPKLFDPRIKIESFYKTNGIDVTKTGSFCKRYNEKN